MYTLVIQPTVDQFCADINKAIDILYRHSNSGTNKNNFSILLSGCFLGVYEDLRSSELLAKNHCFVSLLKIARSLYDLAVQLLWIKNLELEEQQKAIKIFLEFTGDENKQVWYKLINSDMTMGRMVREVGLAHPVYNKSITDLLLPDSQEEKSVDIYGYLSKALHWNPSFLKNIIGSKDEQIQFKTGSQMVAVYIGTLAVRISAYVFAENWLEELFTKEICEKENLRFLLSEITLPTLHEEELTT